MASVGTCESAWVYKHKGLCGFTRRLRGSVKVSYFFRSLVKSRFPLKGPQIRVSDGLTPGMDFVIFHILWSGTDLGESTVLHICPQGPETVLLSEKLKRSPNSMSYRQISPVSTAPAPALLCCCSLLVMQQQLSCGVLLLIKRPSYFGPRFTSI